MLLEDVQIRKELYKWTEEWQRTGVAWSVFSLGTVGLGRTWCVTERKSASDKKMTIAFNVTIQAHKGSGNYKTLSLQFIPWTTAPSKEKE